MKRVFRIFIILVLCFMFAGCELGGAGGSDSEFKGISLNSATFDYDGDVKSIFISGLPEGATVEYVGNEQSLPGKYTVKATVTIGEKTKDFTATITIDDSNTFAGITFDGAEFTFDKSAHSLAAANLPEGFTVTYDGNNQVNAGEYTVKANVKSPFGTVKEYSAKLTIKKATANLSVLENQNMYLDENGKVVGQYEIDNDEQTVSYYFTSGFSGEGEYNVTFEAAESQNYAKVEKTVTAYVYLNQYFISFDNATFLFDGTEKEAVVKNLPAGATVEYVNNKHTDQGRYQVSATVSKDGNELCTVRTIMVIDHPKNAEFESFLDEFLVMMVEEDQMTINFFFVHPENYGLDHYDAEFPIANLDYDPVEAEAEFQEIFGELHAFADANLSFEELATYRIIDNYLNYLHGITEEMEYMTNGYLGSYLGYQANIPLDLAEYKFRNEQDIQDFIDLLNSSVDAFKSYYEYTVEQFNRGYGLTDAAIDSVVSQCEKFVAEKENHYLIDIFNDKIDNIDFELVNKTKDEYKALAKAGIQNELCAAYQYIQEHLPELKGSDIQIGGLSTYGEAGLEYYRLKLGNVVGIHDINITETIKLIDDALSSYNAKMDRVVTQYRNLDARAQNEFLKAVQDGKPVYTKQTPDQLLQMYQELAKQFVPDIAEMPEISIKLVYESLKDNFSPAAYFVSPIDETHYESIYLNPKYTGDYNYIFTTLAHEGYPGHLYQNVYTKSLDIHPIRKLIRSQGYMEGWATYMELKSYQWVTTYNTTPLRLALQYNYLNDIVNGLLSCRVDLGIHTQGWLPEDIAKYMNRVFDSTSYKAADMQDFYDQVVEIPTNMSTYFLSWLILEQLHDKAAAQLGSYFNEVSFNKVILDCGAAPLEIVSERCNQFIEEQKFIYGIE